MEIGHNVMHGQWDWMNNPEIHSSTWDWDTASTKEAWKHSHNYVHHTYTNIRGKDKDLGYEIMRIDPHQKWHPVYLLQPFYNVLLMALFEWGVAFHDLDFEAIRKGEKSKEQVREELKGIAGKARTQIVKDYIAFPALSGLVDGRRRPPASRRSAAPRGPARPARSRPLAPRAGARRRPLERAAVDAVRRASSGARSARRSGRTSTANVVRNFWSNAIIFCGHFPDQTYTFSQEEVEDETQGRLVRAPAPRRREHRGRRRSSTSHRGNLGYQVEHHLFPDMPSTRYGEIAPKVRDVCKRYGLPYNTGPFCKQWGSVQRTILRLAFPGGKPRPKPGPYRGTDTEDVPAPQARSNGKPPEGSAPQEGSNGQPAATENVAAEGPAG